MGGIAVAQLLPMAATTASRVSQSYLGRGRGIWGHLAVRQSGLHEVFESASI